MNPFERNNNIEKSNEKVIDNEKFIKTYSSFKPINTLMKGRESPENVDSSSLLNKGIEKNCKSLSYETLKGIGSFEINHRSKPIIRGSRSADGIGKVSKFMEGYDKAFNSQEMSSPFRMPPSPRKISSLLFPPEKVQKKEEEEEDKEIYTLSLNNVFFGDRTFSSSMKHSFKMFLDHSIIDLNFLTKDESISIFIDHSMITNITLNATNYIEIFFLELPKNLREISSSCNVIRLNLCSKCSISTLRSIFGLNFTNTRVKSQYSPFSGNGPFHRESPRISYHKEVKIDEVLISSAIPPTIDKPRALFTYQPMGASIPITSNELLRLPEGVYFNDALIDFGLSYYYDCSSTSTQLSTHIFSSYFYKKISSSSLDLINDNTNLSIMDPFTKHFNFIPINEKYLIFLKKLNFRLHWYIVLIIGLPFFLDDISKFTEDSSCNIVVFDSLGIYRRVSVIERIKKYIIGEGRRRYNLDIDKSLIRQICPSLPLQMNGTDCGCFVLMYVERFLKDPIEAYNLIIDKVDMTNWIPQNGALICRVRMKSLIESMTEFSSFNEFINDEKCYDKDDDDDVIEIM